jgi:hypothetical protein
VLIPTFLFTDGGTKCYENDKGKRALEPEIRITKKILFSPRNCAFWASFAIYPSPPRRNVELALLYFTSH